MLTILLFSFVPKAFEVAMLVDAMCFLKCKYTVDGNNFSEPELEKSRQIVTKFFFLNGIAGSASTAVIKIAF